jgi:hypothetical protein
MMATTRTWTKAGGGSWETSGNWDTGVPQTGDTVILPSMASAYSVTLSSAAPALNSLTIGDYGSNTNSITLILASGANLHASGAINIAKYGIIEGQGTLQADGGFGVIYSGSGSAQILAGTATSGGTLTVTGLIASNILLGFANTTIDSTLKIATANSLNTISITSSHQTLEIGANVTFSSAISNVAGTIQLDGTTLNAGQGITLSGGTFSGYGTLTQNGNISGTGTIKAVGGVLTLTGSVSQDGSHATALVIGNGSSLLVIGNIGAAGSAPTVTFQGTGDIFQAMNDNLYNIYLGTISGFAGTDLIKLVSYTTSDYLTYDTTAHTITLSDTNPPGSLGGHSHTFYFDSSTDVSKITLSHDTIGSVFADVLSICFMAGTMIRTPEGEAPIETLKRGDLVLTADGEAKPVVWLGFQTIVSRFADPIRNWPIRVLAGAIADNVPCRDLLVSPDHALLVEDVLIHAGALVNGTSIRRESQVPEKFVYYNIELEDHSLMLAENLPAESFVDNVDRRNFDNWAEHEALYPDGRAVAELPLPRAKSLRQVPVSIRAALDERAIAIRNSAAA